MQTKTTLVFHFKHQNSAHFTQTQLYTLTYKQIITAESVCNDERVANAYGIDAILFSFPASSQLNSECNPKRNFSQSSHVD